MWLWKLRFGHWDFRLVRVRGRTSSVGLSNGIASQTRITEEGVEKTMLGLSFGCACGARSVIVHNHLPRTVSDLWTLDFWTLLYLSVDHCFTH
jgi:hypothetical protein